MNTFICSCLIIQTKNYDVNSSRRQINEFRQYFSDFVCLFPVEDNNLYTNFDNTLGIANFRD